MRSLLSGNIFYGAGLLGQTKAHFKTSSNAPPYWKPINPGFVAANVFIDTCLNVDHINKESGGNVKEGSHFIFDHG